MKLKEIMRKKWKIYRMKRKNYKLKESDFGEKRQITSNKLKNLWNGKILLRKKKRNKKNLQKKTILISINN